MNDAARAAELQKQYEFLSHRKWRPLEPTTVGATTTGKNLPLDLVSRVAASYRTANKTSHHAGSIWTEYFYTKNQASHVQLMEGNLEQIAAIWENPADNYAFWGFDDLHPDYTSVRKAHAVEVEIAAHRAYDNLIQLGAAAGVTRLEYPEAPPIEFEGIETILSRLDEVMGFAIDFPNPYPLEFGLQTSRGVASYRAIQALFQAYQTKQLVNVASSRILEIGPGLGRAAYYAIRAGASDYTLIDLPFANVSQAFFLGLTLSPRLIQLSGESSNVPAKIATPDAFLEAEDSYDLVVNFDSLTEMPNSVQRSYVSKIRDSAATFLSVNHEYNGTTVRSLICEILPDKVSTRNPYWMRRGYVQEIVDCN